MGLRGVGSHPGSEKDATGLLRVPSSLSGAEREVWQEIVTACDPRHFRESDARLLIAYCGAAALERRREHPDPERRTAEERYLTQPFGRRDLQTANHRHEHEDDARLRSEHEPPVGRALGRRPGRDVGELHRTAL